MSNIKASKIGSSTRLCDKFLFIAYYGYEPEVGGFQPLIVNYTGVNCLISFKRLSLCILVI